MNAVKNVYNAWIKNYWGDNLVNTLELQGLQQLLGMMANWFTILWIDNI